MIWKYSNYKILGMYTLQYVNLITVILYFLFTFYDEWWSYKMDPGTGRKSATNSGNSKKRELYKNSEDSNPR